MIAEHAWTPLQPHAWLLASLCGCAPHQLVVSDTELQPGGSARAPKHLGEEFRHTQVCTARQCGLAPTSWLQPRNVCLFAASQCCSLAVWAPGALSGLTWKTEVPLTPAGTKRSTAQVLVPARAEAGRRELSGHALTGLGSPLLVCMYHQIHLCSGHLVCTRVPHTGASWE